MRREPSLFVCDMGELQRCGAVPDREDVRGTGAKVGINADGLTRSPIDARDLQGHPSCCWGAADGDQQVGPGDGRPVAQVQLRFVSAVADAFDRGAGPYGHTLRSERSGEHGRRLRLFLDQQGSARPPPR